MPCKWMDVSDLSFNTLLLLEQVQLSWLPGWLPENELGVALKANPVVEWYMRHKCPQLNEWLDRVLFTVQDDKLGDGSQICDISDRYLWLGKVDG